MWKVETDGEGAWSVAFEGDVFNVVIDCDSEEDAEALFDVLARLSSSVGMSAMACNACAR